MMEYLTLKRCAVPGCGRGLEQRNSSGVCYDHQHDPDHCACKACTHRRATAPRPMPDPVPPPDYDRAPIEVICAPLSALTMPRRHLILSPEEIRSERAAHTIRAGKALRGSLR